MNLPFKIYLSYFYKIRFFDKYIIPVSTAIYDPAWYHDNKCVGYVYKNDKDVINGLRIECLNPSKVDCHDCSKDCKDDPKSCRFITSYHNMLNRLNFDEVIEQLKSLSDTSKLALNLDRNPDVCLIVHEAPTNLCSERRPLMEYFKEHGIELEEFDETLYNK